jgi:hypothetical protein
LTSSLIPISLLNVELKSIETFAIANFFYQLSEAMLLYAEEGLNIAIQIHSKKKQDKKRKERQLIKQQQNQRIVKNNDSSGLILMIDDNIIREMYPNLVQLHSKTKTMVEIHHALEMSEWNEEKANKCLNRRSTLRKRRLKLNIERGRSETSPSASSASSASSTSSASSASSANSTFSSHKNPYYLSTNSTLSSSLLNVEEWQCKDCTYINIANDVECIMCASPSTLIPPSKQLICNYKNFIINNFNNNKEESLCFICKDGGQLITCDYPKCSKVYHHVCVGIQNNHGNMKKWYCPQHYCYECAFQGKKWISAISKCVFCPLSSKCKDHYHWSPLPKASFILHDQVEKDSNNLKETNNDGKSDTDQEEWLHGESLEGKDGIQAYFNGSWFHVKVLNHYISSPGLGETKEERINVEYNDGSGKQWIVGQDILKRIKIYDNRRNSTISSAVKFDVCLKCVELMDSNTLKIH